MNNNRITTPGELYAVMMEATSPAERDHHASDLYIKITPVTLLIMDLYEYRHQVSTFHDETDPRHALWFDIPFAYLPYWQGQRD